MAWIPGLKPLVVLGVTGSIGRQTLDVARSLDVPIRAVAARSGSDDLMENARENPEALVAIASPTPSERDQFRRELGGRARFGPDALEELAALDGSIVVNGIVGVAGLPASVAALRAGNRLALANKESLVAGGPVVDRARREGGGELVPVDSEHSALAQCLAGEDSDSIQRVVLTASGGPFRGRTAEQLEGVTVAEALAHPTWDMGPRITVDSATLMNKAFEVIEAHYLFAIPYDKIEVVVHPQSIVHSIVEFVDGSLKAQLGPTDMRIPIQYAITYPSREPGPAPAFELLSQELTFEEPDRESFPSLDLGYSAGREGGSSPAVLNAADETAVRAFLDGQIGFSSIPLIAGETLERVRQRSLDSVQDVFEVDAEARDVAQDVIGRFC